MWFLGEEWAKLKRHKMNKVYGSFFTAENTSSLQLEKLYDKVYKYEILNLFFYIRFHNRWRFGWNEFIYLILLQL